MASKPVRVVSVGSGRWAGVIADGVSRVPDLEIAGCFSRSENRRNAFAEKYGCRPYPSYDAVLADEGIDAVLLITPHSVHHLQILAAAQAGKHVFVEKPMTLTVADGKEAIQACDDAKVTLMVGHCWRWMEPIRRLKSVVEAGELGKVFQATGHFGNPRALDLGEEQWRDDPAQSPGGPLTGPGFHLLDLLRYVLGPVKEVCGVFRRHLDSGQADDTAGVMLEFESGAFGLASTSFLTPVSFRFSLYGSDANAFVSLNPRRGSPIPSELRIQRIDASKPSDPVELGEEDMIAGQMAEFARCVRTGDTPLSDGREGLDLIAVLEALVESVRSHGWVSMKSVLG